MDSCLRSKYDATVDCVKDTSCQAGEGADLNWWQLYLHATHLFSSFSYAMTIPNIKYKEGEYHPMPTLLGLVDRHQHLQVISSTLLNARDSGQTSISLSWYLKEEADYIASTYEPHIDFGDFKSQWTRRIIEMARSLSIPMVSFLMDRMIWMDQDWMKLVLGEWFTIMECCIICYPTTQQ